MMTTEKQLEANCKNALMSTGPKTPNGKAIISLNALKHGIFAREVVIVSGDGREEESEYYCLLAELTTDLEPRGRLEALLVEKMAVNYWRLRRLIRYETGEVRTLLDDFKAETVEAYYDDSYSFSPGKGRTRPVMIHYDYGDDISDAEYQKQDARVDVLSSAEFNPANDDEAVKYVFFRGVREDSEDPSEEDLKKVRKYLRQLSPQVRGKLRKELFNEATQILMEMEEVRRWGPKFDRIAQANSLPHENVVDKIIKYENSLERSILRNLAALKALQERRSRVEKRANMAGEELNCDDS